MIVLLGNTGYIGQAFEVELRKQGREFVGLSRKECDYTQFDSLLRYLQKTKPDFLINAAGYTGKPNVDACETHWADTLLGNAFFPSTLANVCSVLGLPFGHVSSGCIYSGAKVVENDSLRVERDLTRPELQCLIRRNPSSVQGFTESDEPNFCFRHPPCSFYSGSKALGEEMLSHAQDAYIWRLRIPFDEFDNPRNYLSKIQNYTKVYDNVNSLSHRGDFVRACLELWERRAPFGIYNMTNPGFVTTRQVVALINEIRRPNRVFRFWANDEEFYRTGASTPRSNCVLDGCKLQAAGVTMRPVLDAVTDSLRNWVVAVRRQSGEAIAPLRHIDAPSRPSISL